MTSTSIQLRGHCQCCGRLQAVRGLMSKHGYRVRGQHGYAFFEGVCPGEHYQPIEKDRSQADLLVASTRARSDMADRYAEDIEQGRITQLMTAGQRWNSELREYVPVPWDEAIEYDRRGALRSAAYSSRFKAKSMRSAAADLEALCDSVHGQPLQEVARAAAQAPLANAVQGPAGVLTLVRVDGARAYWRSATGRTSWMGTQAWRRLPAVA